MIEERNLGEWDHAGLQSILDRMFGAREETQEVWISTQAGVEQWSDGLLRVPGTKIEVDPATAFERLRQRRGVTHQFL